MAAPASAARPRRAASNRFPQRASSDDDERGAASDDSFDSGSEIDQDDTADFAAPGASKKAKRPRVPKAKATKATKGAATTRPKKSKAAPSGAGGAKKRQAGGSKGTTRSAARKEELDIAEDVPLFNAVKNPETALQTTAEDWVVAYQSDPGPALTELVNFFVRCCGCNASTDEQGAMDLDNVVDTLEEIQEDFRKTQMPSYPLVSRAPAFKKFKRSLSEFVARLLQTASESELLLVAPTTESSSEDVIDHPLLNVLKEWLSSFSSSTFRSFRHTSTFIVLNIIEGLAALSVDKRKSVEVARKQRDAEKKKPRVDKGRLRALEEKWKAEKEEEIHLQDGIRDLVDGVFQHRYRDADPLIRTDCATELGRWMKTYPDMFMRAEYHRYLGWCLSDANAAVRIAAMRALAGLYARSAFPDALRHFTEVHKARLVQMAVGDIDLTVRVATIEVLIHIDRRDLLEDEQRDEVGMHIFDVEPRIRSEVSRFLLGLVEEQVEEQVDDTIGPAPVSSTAAGKDVKSKEQRAKWEAEVRKLRFKILAENLVRYEQAIDDLNGSAGQAASTSTSTTPQAQTLVAEGDGRIGLAIEALWSFDDDEGKAPLSSASTLLETLLYDHSAGQDDADAENGRGGRAKGRRGGANGDAPAAATGAAAAAIGYSGSQPGNEAYRLLPAEETVLLEALVAIVKHMRRLSDAARTAAALANKGEPSDVREKERLDDLTRTIVPALPKLFAKYRTESQRVSEVLLLVPTLDLELYAATGQTSTFSSLWDEVSTQFQRHSESSLLKRGATAIRALVSSATNHASLTELTGSKLVTLQDSLVGALREPLKGKDVGSTAFDEDTRFALQVNLERLAEIGAATDCCEVMEDTEDGQVSSGWEIIRVLAMRGSLRYDGEERMVAMCLRVMTIHLLWKLRTLLSISPTASAQAGRDALVGSLLAQRNDAFEAMQDLMSGSSSLPIVSSAAASRLLQLYAAFHSAQSADAAVVAAARQRQNGIANGGGEDGVDEEAGEETAGHVAKLPKSLHISIAPSTQEACVQVVLAQVQKYINDGEDEQEQTQERAQAQDGAGDDSESELSDIGSRSSGSARPSSRRAKSKSKEPNATTATASSLPSQARLEAEVELNQLVAPLVTATRLGLIDVRLVAPLIGHFGRAGRMYDSLVKFLIEVLREEGILGRQSSKAVDVIFDSLRDSFEAYLTEDTVEAEVRFISLSRSISSALCIRGAHLAILKAIEPKSLEELHRRGAEYVAKKWKAAERAGNKAIKAKAPAFWKGMSNLLVAAGPRDAQHIKTAMEKALSDEKVDISPDSKIWDPQRQYEKRLVTLMAKRAPVASAAKAGATPRRKAAAGAGAGDEHNEHGDHLDGDVDMEMPPPIESTPARPKPRPAAAAGNGGKRGSAARRERSESALTELSDGEGGKEDEGRGAEDAAAAAVAAAAAAAESAPLAMDEDDEDDEDDDVDGSPAGGRRKRADSIASSMRDSLPPVTSKRRRLVVD